MPNWCECKLDVILPKNKGAKEELFNFKKFAKTKDSDLDTNKFIPYPKKYSSMDKRSKTIMEKTGKSIRDGFNSGGYNWCLNNWGTKWGICDANYQGIHIQKTQIKLSYNFITAWSPCNPIILKMSKMFPKMKFVYRYWEGGSGFRGTIIFKANKILKDSCYDYKGYRGG